MNQSQHTKAAERRFSDSEMAQQWTQMYASETERLEEANFRQRRDVTVNYVIKVLPAGGRVLDVGCGAAPVLSLLRQRGLSCTGLEYSEDMLKHARERLRAMDLDTGDLHRGDCLDMPFEDASFDVIVCLGVVSYVEDYSDLLAEIHRLLKPGGCALISFRNKFNPILSDPARIVKTAIKILIGRMKPDPYVIGRFMDHREFRSKMAEQGFTFRDFFGIGFGPFKFNYRNIFGERRSIKISNALARVFEKIRWKAPFRWMADVSLWVYTKPVSETDT